MCIFRRFASNCIKCWNKIFYFQIFKDSQTSSAPKLQQRSPSLSPVVDKEIEDALVLKEADELIYDKVKADLVAETDESGEKTNNDVPSKPF